MDDIKKALEAIEAKCTETLSAQAEEIKNHGEVSTETKAELESLKDEVKELNNSILNIQQKGVKAESTNSQESVGSLFAASSKLQDYLAGSTSKATQKFENNTITTTSGGVATRQDLGGALPLYAPLRLLDAIASVNSSESSVTFVKEASSTNNAAPTAEGSEPTESVNTYTEVTLPFKRVPNSIKASKIQLNDSEIVASMIDNRLSNNVDDVVEKQIILGDGTGSNFSGLATSGYVTESDVTEVETNEDALHVLKTEMLAAGATPAFYLLNPSDYGSMERAKGTANDHYIGVVGKGMAWEVPCVQSTHVPAGTAYLVARDAITLVTNGGVEVSVSDSDDDNFTKGLVTIQAEKRANVMIPYANTVFMADLSDVGTAE